MLFTDQEARISAKKKESNIKPEPRRFMDDGRVEMIGQGLDCEGIGRAVEMGW